jgi:hypothetical protein
LDQFPAALALVALGGLQSEPAEPAHPDPLKDARHRRDRHLEHFGDLRAGHPQPPQRRDRLHSPLTRAVRDHRTRRTAIEQAGL